MRTRLGPARGLLAFGFSMLSAGACQELADTAPLDEGGGGSGVSGSAGSGASSGRGNSSGGSAAQAMGGSAGEADPGRGGTGLGGSQTGAGGNAGDGGEPATAGEPGSSGSGATGGGGPPIVNGCGNYQDRTAPNAVRTLAWDLPIAESPERCLRILAGQSVTWSGDLAAHPFDVDPPVAGELDSSGGAFSITFASEGVYAFTCIPHSQMAGAIWVTAAP